MFLKYIHTMMDIHATLPLFERLLIRVRYIHSYGKANVTRAEPECVCVWGGGGLVRDPDPTDK